LGWRLAFGLGAIIGTAMIIARRFVPESPRWLMTHGRIREAEEIMDSIEQHAVGHKLPPIKGRLKIHGGARISFSTIIQTILVRYRMRAVLGLVLIVSQAFFYNGISFSFPLVLGQFYDVPIDRIGLYVLVMAAANFLGPLLLGHFFDTIGRRRMISGTYALSGILILATLPLFLRHDLTAQTQTLVWAATFFFASAAASAGYLTVSEVFPLEMRALAIALFYALGTAIGGLGAPALFGRLLESGITPLAGGYLFGAVLMLVAAVIEWLLGVDSEQKSLEDVTSPLSADQPLQSAAT
jgi:MFS family permease